MHMQLTVLLLSSLVNLTYPYCSLVSLYSLSCYATPLTDTLDYEICRSFTHTVIELPEMFVVLHLAMPIDSCVCSAVMLWAVFMECAVSAIKQMPSANGQLPVLRMTVSSPSPGIHLVQAKQAMIEVSASCLVSLSLQCSQFAIRVRMAQKAVHHCAWSANTDGMNSAEQLYYAVHSTFPCYAPLPA